MDFRHILFDTRDHVARITLNSPKTLNGYHEPMLAEICAAVQTAREDDGTRVVILTGAGKAFCSGGDVSGSEESRSRFHRQKMGYLIEMREGMHQTVLSLTRLDKPLIGAINGAAVAGGLTLACAAILESPRTRRGWATPPSGSDCFPTKAGRICFPASWDWTGRSRCRCWARFTTRRPRLQLGLVTEVVAARQAL